MAGIEEKSEILDRLGYSGARLETMLAYLQEYERRLNVVGASPLSTADIVSASLIFDAFNRRQKGK